MTSSSDPEISAARRGNRAYYFWQYPNLMINCYEGYMDTNLVIPLSVDRCRVIFDFYFDKTGGEHDSYNQQSIEVSNRVQMEDAGICEDVQRGLHPAPIGKDACRFGVKLENIYSIDFWPKT